MGKIRSAVLSVLAVSLLAVPGLSAEEKTDEQIKKDYLTAGLNRKGVELFDRKKWDQALYNFEKAHEVNPTNSVIRKNLIAAYGEVIGEETALQRWERIPPLQEKALRIVSDPEDGRIFWPYYARFLSRIAQEAPPDKWRELSAGVPDASVPREFKPPVSGMLHNLAVEAYRRKDTKNARAFALRSLQLKPFYETYLLLGNLYQQEERLEEARGAFLAARGLKKTKEADERLRKEAAQEEHHPQDRGLPNKRLRAPQAS
jgi:tetratricopeptide (TPR) repeat protein